MKKDLQNFYSFLSDNLKCEDGKYYIIKEINNTSYIKKVSIKKNGSFFILKQKAPFKAELFKNKLMAKIYKAYNVFPIKRGQKDAGSLLHSINVIQEHDNAKLLIFPEGTRIKKGKERGRAKVGPVFIASKAGVPILPVHITKNPKLFSKVTVVFGEPITLPENIHENKEELQKYSDMLLDKIYELKEYEK